MPAYHGPAQVSVSARHVDLEPATTVNHALLVTLARNGPAHYARLEFSQALLGPERGNHVQVLLPTGLALGGTLLEGDRGSDGSGWLIFHVEEGDWRQLE